MNSVQIYRTSEFHHENDTRPAESDFSCLNRYSDRLIALTDELEACTLEVSHLDPEQSDLDPCLVRIFFIESYRDLLDRRLAEMLQGLKKRNDCETTVGILDFSCREQYPDNILMFDDVFTENQNAAEIANYIRSRFTSRLKSVTSRDARLIKKFAHLNLVGQSQVHLSLLKKICKIANFYFAPVLIEGETGTGKENVSRAIHYLSDRRDNGFYPVNCGAIPDSLFESELFGHEKGAFTNAYQKQPGLIELADNGTLFLDEVDALSSKGQAALLRFLQTGEYRSLGSAGIKTSSVRIISASNANLEELVEKKEFREDLLFRLNVFKLELPPLRERTDDIEIIAKFLLDKFSKNYEIERKLLHPSSLEWLNRHSWQGNVRELENTLLREFLLSDSSVLRFGSEQESGQDEESLQIPDESLQDFRSAKIKIVEKFEKRYVESMLARTLGNVSEAARLAGKERRSFGKLIKKYNIDRSSYE